MPDERDLARGRRLLLSLLPWARAEVRKGDGKWHPESPLGSATVAAVRPENLDALVIYPAPLGGWHADIVLRDMPDGMPNVIGTPVGHPMPTREAAERHGKNNLVAILMYAAERDAAAAPPRPVFLFYGWAITLFPEVYVAAREKMPDYLETIDQNFGIERIESFLSKHFPGGYQGESPDTWPLPQMLQFMAIAHQAAFCGVFVYPVRNHGKPARVA